MNNYYIQLSDLIIWPNYQYAIDLLTDAINRISTTYLHTEEDKLNQVIVNNMKSFI